MKSVLEQYRDYKKSLAAMVPGLSPTQLFRYQEAAYRVQVLEYFRLLTHTAPVSVDLSALSAHYGVMDAMVSHLLTERRYRQSADAEVQAARETAASALLSVVTDYRKRYAAYMPETGNQYRKDISDTICTVLPAWLQYRETMMPINQETGGETTNEQ